MFSRSKKTTVTPPTDTGSKSWPTRQPEISGSFRFSDHSASGTKRLEQEITSNPAVMYLAEEMKKNLHLMRVSIISSFQQSQTKALQEMREWFLEQEQKRRVEDAKAHEEIIDLIKSFAQRAWPLEVTQQESSSLVCTNKLKVMESFSEKQNNCRINDTAKEALVSKELDLEDRRVAWFKRGIPIFLKDDDPEFWAKHVEKKRIEYQLTWSTVLLSLRYFFSQGGDDSAVIEWFESQRPLLQRALRKVDELEHEEAWEVFKKELIAKFDILERSRQADVDLVNYKWDPHTTRLREFVTEVTRLYNLASLTVSSRANLTQTLIEKLPPSIGIWTVGHTYPTIANFTKSIEDLLDAETEQQNN